MAVSEITVKDANDVDRIVAVPEVRHVIVDSGALPTGAATSAKQDAIVAAIEGIAAGGDATAANQEAGNASLASILAKIIAAPSTEAKQDAIATAIGLLGTQTTSAAILAKLSADPATQTTLAAILAKLIAAPATEAKQDTANTALGTLATQTTAAAILAKLSADPATQTTLAALLAKVIAAPATEAKQDAAIVQETAINTVLGTKADAKSVATDTTAISAISIWKQISASIQAAAASLASLVSGAATLESGRNPVNTISGQTGVAGGAGAVGATTQRVTNASDDPNRPRFFAATGTFNRATNTTAYTANDEVSQQSPAVIAVTVADANDAPIALRRLRINTTEAQFAGKNFRAWLYSVSKTPGADNGAFATTRANFIGTMSGILRAASDGGIGVLVPDEGAEIITTPISGAATISVRLQILDATSSPTASTTVDMVLEGFQGRA